MGGWLKGRSRQWRRLAKRWGAQEGFTLIELMVVLAVLAVLGLLAVPKLWGAVRTATQQVAVEQAHQIRSAMEMYKAEEKGYPADSNVENLSELATVLDRWIDIETANTSAKIFAATVSYNRSSNGKSYTLELFIPATEDPTTNPADWRKITITPDGVVGPSALDPNTDPTTINWQ
ncbi:type II secretion system protein [Caldinitratiruptor microaerophilus]|uniref:Prepilin-type N-terminal cleavage/methylation domain-containing protein n=1 Tax=Caldinitratiruptor microaerophilus TaxID=671077 RepID=A0AA35CKG3_9FIRM|nr:prepilin-type N-terminal cleavage/methylation domain-containing protein [Caldinitratiruptor microaerophilus]BDG60872.1 hypothetical protein caldi_19620 [Caldinitratiruptor microaerophilus]